VDSATDEELLDVRAAAAAVGRHPETVRRWVWSGRLPATRRGNRLLVARRDLESLADTTGTKPLTLAEWAARTQARLEASAAAQPDEPPRSAADLVLEDRWRRSAEDWPYPGR